MLAQRDIIALTQLKGLKKTVARQLIDDPTDTSHLLLSLVSVDLLDSARRKADVIIENCKRDGIKLRTILDNEYPQALLSIDNPPLVVYVKGDISLLNKPAVTVVGTREPESESLEAAAQFAAQLVAQHYVIVSGMALGCDTAAHEGTLEAGGLTIGVLPAGVDKIHPKENVDLAKKILSSGGCLVSEYPPATRPMHFHFHLYSRIQSGLSDATLVVASGDPSGTLKTADLCRKQGRTLLSYRPALHKLDNPTYRGNKRLIDSGAIGLDNPSDLAKVLPTPPAVKRCRL